MTPDIADFPEVATEAIVVVDLTESASTSNLFGWYAVGRSLMRDLRSMIHEVGDTRGLQCLKSTGDGYLLAFRDSSSAELAVLHAVESALLLLNLIAERNRVISEERVINLRFAIHFGEVDVIANDREGPHVTYAFRLEGIDRDSLIGAFNPIPPEDLPLRNYILCSEEAAGILERRSSLWQTVRIGLLKLKGFPGWREVFLYCLEVPVYNQRWKIYMVKFTSKPMTYGRLWDTLIALGYTRTDAPEYIVFREEEHDALIALPIREPDTELHFWHHSSSRSNVFGRGIASKETFERMLTKPAVVEIAAKTGMGKVNAPTRTGFVRPRKKGVVTATSRTAVRKAEDAPSLQELHAEKT